MSMFTLSGWLLAATCFILAFIVFLNGQTKLHRLWIFFNIAVGLWGVGTVLVGNARTFSDAFIAWKLAFVGGIFIPVAFFHTTAVFCDVEKKLKNIILFAYIWGIAYSILDTTPLLVPGVEVIYNGLYYVKAGLLLESLSIVWIGLVIWGHIELASYYVSAKGIKRTQALYFFVGMVMGFAGGTTNFLPMFGVKMYPFGNFTIPIYVFIVTYAIFRYRLMDISVAITRLGIFIFVYAAVLGFPIYFGYKTNLWLWSTIFMAILATVGPSAYRAIKERAESIILAEQRKYQNILIQAAEGMAKEPTLEKLLKLIVYLVKMTVRVRFSAIFLCDERTGGCVLRSSRDNGMLPEQLAFSEDHPFVSCINLTTEPFLPEELPDEIKETIANNFLHGLIVPLSYAKKPLGFMVIGEKLNGKIYTEDDIKAFKILAQQLALAVINRMSTGMNSR